MKKIQIISFGESVIDLYGSRLDHTYVSTKYDLRLGGGAAIFAITCQRLGFDTTFITSFSNDSYGQFLYKLIESEKVDLSYTGLVHENTPLVFINSTKDYKDYKFYGSNFGALEIPNFELDNKLLENVKVFHFTSFALLNNNNFEVLIKLLKDLKKRDVLIYFNFNLRSRLKKTTAFFNKIFECLKYTDIVISNRIDYEQIFNETDEKELMKKVFEFKLKKAIITRGREGAKIYSNAKKCVPTTIDFRVTTTDSTGAGSIFAASYICNVLDGKDDEESINTAHKMAAISTTRKGAIEAIPTRDEIQYIKSDEDLLKSNEKTIYAISTIDKKSDKNYFSNFVKESKNKDPLIITQKTYSKVKKYFEKDSNNVIYITKSPRNKLSYLPTRLEQLFFIINLYSIKHKDGVVLLDCMDILLKYNSLTKLINFLYQISNLSVMGSIKFVLVLDYEMLHEDEKLELLKLKLLTNRMEDFSKNENVIQIRNKYLKSHIGENLVDVKDKKELYKRIKDILKDVYGFSFVNIYELENEVLLNINKYAKRRYIHLDNESIFKDCIETKKNIVINKVEDDIYLSENRTYEPETISCTYFDTDFMPTILIPFGKEEAIGLIEMSKETKIEVNSEDFKEITGLIKNAFFLAEIFILKEIAQKNAKQLRHLDDLKNNFLSMISHELRTPLTSIKGYSNLLKNEKLGPLNDQQKKSLEILEKETSNLTVLINDLLDISKIESGKLDLYKSNENIKDVIIDSIQIMEGFATERDIKIDFDKSFKAILNIDSSRIHQVLTNLLNNAIKFSNPNTTIKIRMKEVELNTEAKKEIKNKFQSQLETKENIRANHSQINHNNFICIEVEDSGCGIEEKNIPLLFDKFFQISNNLTKSVGGTGLGLSIVKKLIEMHDGLIDVESEFTKGSKFIIYLPRESISKNDTKQPESN